MTIHHEDSRATLHHGDCLDVMGQLADNSVDSIVTDPPYGLGFMGKAWDDLPPGEDWARECLRVLKPGGHLLAFGGTRTWHRLACAVEDAGFEVRDSIAWLYGSGFPKSLDVSKAIDKAAGAEREVVGFDEVSWSKKRAEHERGEDSKRRLNEAHDPGRGGYTDAFAAAQITAPATDAAREWAGWGTALKPAFEPVVVARKPLTGTVAANVQAWGTGALNIDASRIGTSKNVPASPNGTTGANGIYGGGFHAMSDRSGMDPKVGRWPANVILDEDMAGVLDEQAPNTGASGRASGPSLTGPTDASVAYGARNGLDREAIFHNDSGGASRFFYVAKAPKKERPVVDLPCKVHEIKRCTICGPTTLAHPTVKPLALMRWLVRLVTPPGGTVLEPFAGSGATVEACLLEGFRCIAIEKGDEYLPLILARIQRQSDPLPEAVELVRTVDEDAAILEQIAGQLDIFGEGVA